MDGEVRMGVERQQPIQAETDVSLSASGSSTLRPRLTLDGDIGARSDGARTPEGAPERFASTQRTAQRSRRPPPPSLHPPCCHRPHGGDDSTHLLRAE